MKYQSQRIAYYFFAVSMLLLCLQILYGFIMAFAHVGYDVLHAVIPFNVARATHLNLLVVWLLSGFMGAAHFIIPDETGQELYSTPLAVAQLVSLVLVGVVAIIGFHFQWWEGRKFLEIPRPLDYLVVVNVLMFVANIGITLWRSARRTTTSIVLFMGLLSAALLYLPGMIDTTNQTMDSYWRWWVVHLWVEGVWELIMGAILAYLLIKLTGVDREMIEKWLYLIVGLTFLSGILGTGHHYYYIGTPSYWLWIGGIFSALEPLAFFGMAAYAVAMVRRGGRRHPNSLALSWTVGCAIMSFVGAGVLGFAHTLPQINLYTHGTLVTAMHAHLAFWGRLRHAGARHDFLRPAATHRTQALQHRRCGVCLLDFQHRYGQYDGGVRGSRGDAGLPRTAGGDGFSRRPRGVGAALLGRRAGGGPVHRRHPGASSTPS